MKRRSTAPVYTPTATYRLQFNKNFTFTDAAGLVEYLDALGITDAYASPFLMARPGSVHGYDVTDHTRLNPEIGGRASLEHFSAELRKRDMGLLVDVVPNHMCISHPSNRWWWDVLENGPSSAYARFFDIEWHPSKSELDNKVLLPVLGDQFGHVLEEKKIQAVYRDGGFHVEFYGSPVPLAPQSWTVILDPAAAKMRELAPHGDEHLAELESIITALGHLAGPNETDEARSRERQREKEVMRRRLSALMDASDAARSAIEQTIAEINGTPGDPHSFDRLEKLLESEAYRLSFWRVAMDEVNYRRFFDINDLAAIRVEDPEVFATVHALIFELIERGEVTGLRIDHPDGLFEPEKYFRFLQDAALARTGGSAPNGNGLPRTFYIVAEKILTGNEQLRTSWAIEGTTGYNFLNLLNGVFVDRSKQRAFEQLYRRFTGIGTAFADIVFRSKRLILQVSMSSELNALARALDRLSEQHRWYRDFTLESLRNALREVIAAFPVYRTYIRGDDKEVDPEDRRQIVSAIREAQRRNPAISESVFAFIQSVLLLEHPEGLDESQRAERHVFAMKLQQLTAPVMAKGIEDTAFYRYYPLCSLNEVGGDPDRFGVSLTAFHRRNLIRSEISPHSMSATSTHDTKRGEDVRARINVLSEMPSEWARAIRRWREMNRQWKTKIGSAMAPDANEEYLFYQTLLGTWPLQPMSAESHSIYMERLQTYMEKALHEAKLHTSWISPNAEYEQAVRQFVQHLLDPEPGNAFLDDFLQFQAPLARAGLWNSISQTVLKTASPGVPDFYQGNELWCFDLVDPDNRHPVDYEPRKKMLAGMLAQWEESPGALLDRLVANPCDGGIKMYVTARALAARKKHRELFSQGSYFPLPVSGGRGQSVVAFARQFERATVIVLAGRFFLRMFNGHPAPIGDVWGSTVATLPKKIEQRVFHEVFSGDEIAADANNGRVTIPLAKAFAHAPVALLIGHNNT